MNLKIKITKTKAPWWNKGDEYDVYQSPYGKNYWRITETSGNHPGVDIPKAITDHKR